MLGLEKYWKCFHHFHDSRIWKKLELLLLQLTTSRHASFNIRIHTCPITHIHHNLNLGSKIQPPPPYHSNHYTHFFPCLLYQPSLHPHPLYCLWPKAYIHKMALSSKTTIPRPLAQDVLFTPHPKTSIYFIQPLGHQNWVKVMAFHKITSIFMTNQPTCIFTNNFISFEFIHYKNKKFIFMNFVSVIEVVAKT